MDESHPDGDRQLTPDAVGEAVEGPAEPIEQANERAPAPQGPRSIPQLIRPLGLQAATPLTAYRREAEPARRSVPRLMLALVVILAVIPQDPTAANQTALTRNAAQPDLARSN